MRFWQVVVAAHLTAALVYNNRWKGDFWAHSAADALTLITAGLLGAPALALAEQARMTPSLTPTAYVSKGRA